MSRPFPRAAGRLTPCKFALLGAADSLSMGALRSRPIASQAPQNSPDAHRVEEHFSREAEEYTEASASGLWKWWRRKEVAAIMRLLQPASGELILDAGSGAGFYSEQLIAAGARVVACDLSAPMVRAAHRRLGVGGVVCDLQTRLPLKPAFGAVLCAGALEFCPSPEQAVVSLGSVFAPEPNARLVLMLPSETLQGRLYRRFHSRHGIAIHLFSRNRLKNMAENAGLHLEALRPIGFNYVVLMRPKQTETL